MRKIDSNNDSSHHARRTRKTSRRGAMTLAFLLVFVVFLTAAALAIHWSYLVLSQRNLQHRADLMALAGAPSLLDEDLLRDAEGTPHADQSGDVADAKLACLNYCDLNNVAGPRLLALSEQNLRITPGYLPNPHDGPNSLLVSNPEAAIGGPFNALRVDALRSTGGIQGLVLGGKTATHQESVNATAVAALDNLVVGFRPTMSASSPVVPLAVEASAWSTERRSDQDGNGINEIDLRLKSADAQALPANALLVGFSGHLDLDAMPMQVTTGIYPADLPAPSFAMGPATPTHALNLPATNEADGSLSSTLAAQFRLLTLRGDAACRVLPVVRVQAAEGLAPVVGFVAARVLGSRIEAGRLVVRVEPCYLIHFTAWTVPPSDPLGPERNPYINKLCLSR